MIGAPSFPQPYLWIQSSLQSRPKIRSSTSLNFHLAIPFLFFNKIILTIHTITPPSMPQQYFTSIFLRTAITTIYTQNMFPTPAI